MTENTTERTAAGVWPTMVYRDAQAAIRFLTEGLGFEQVAVHPGESDGEVAHAEFAWPAGGGVMLSSAVEGNEFAVVADGVTSVYLVTADPDAAFERATEAGARVLRPLRDEDYGNRGFTVLDHEDNRWSFGTYRGES